MSKRNNNITLLHFIGILLIMHGHQFAIMGLDSTDVVNHATSTIGVNALFVLSGYLQMNSVQKTPFKEFIKRKILRILPDYYLYLIVMTFIVGAIISTSSLSEYYLSKLTYIYFIKNALFYPCYYLPGVFDTAVIKNCVNICLWTLPIEFALHLLLPIILRICLYFDKQKNGKLLFSIFTMFSIGLFYYQLKYGVSGSLNIWGTNIFKSYRLVAYFFIGCWFKLLSLEKYINHKLFIISILLLTFEFKDYSTYIIPIVIVFGVITFIRDEQIFDIELNKLNFSYAMYLWMFPIQQIVFQYLPRFNKNIYLQLGISFFLTVVVSILMTKIKDAIMKGITVRFTSIKTAIN